MIKYSCNQDVLSISIILTSRGGGIGRPACRQAGAQLSKTMYYVYILLSLKKSVFYKGLTDNLSRRLKQHFSGKVPATKHLLPLMPIHVELCESRKEARKLEKYFKSGYGREIIKEIVKQRGQMAELVDA